ncbi:MAG: ATP-binding protein [Syntrophales bacterium]
MPPVKKLIWQYDPRRHSRPFLRPLAAAIACAVFIGLILIMGILDLRRVNNTLVGFMENQGLNVVNVIQKLAQENLNLLVQVHKREGQHTFVPLTDEAFSPKNWLTNALVNLGRTIDNEWKANQLNDAYLKKIALDNGLWLVTVLDAKDQIVFRSSSLPAEFYAGDNSNEQQVVSNFFTQLGQMKKIGFIALRRKDGSGTIVIALDSDGLRYWSAKVSVEKALEKLGEGQGLSYIRITDRRGMILGGTGRVPEKWKDGGVYLFSQILAGKRKIVSRKVSSHDINLLDILTPLYLNGQVVGIARLGLELSGTDQILEENKRNIFVSTSLIVLIAFLFMWLLYHNQNKHLRRIVEMERRIEKAERLSALGQLAAGVAHEIRNPLNAISMASQRLKRECIPADGGKTEELQTLTGVIRDEIRRLNGIIEEFLAFSKSRRLEIQNYSITDLLQKVANLIQEEAAAKGITIQTKWSNYPAIIPMDIDKLQQAMLNFIKNAVESISGEGSVTISVKPEGNRRLGIKISDTGCGMTPSEVDQIFNPEYTTKERGLGLGLSLAHEIIRGHGGKIRVFSRQGSGTTFEILLPAVRYSPTDN